MAGEMNVFMLFGLWYIFIAYNYFMETLDYQKGDENKNKDKSKECRTKPPRGSQQASEQNIPQEQNNPNKPSDNDQSEEKKAHSEELSLEASNYNLQTMTPEQIHEKVEEIASGLGIDQELTV